MRGSKARAGRARLGALTGLVIIALGACSEDRPQSVLRPAGEYARKADGLWDLTFGVAVVIFLLVEGALVFTLFRYRARPGREASQFHGNAKLEVILTLVPALILAGIAVPTIRTVFDLASKPEGALPITIKAHQFWWEYQYPGAGVVTANELHIPTGRPVYLTMEGELADRVSGGNEVNHSFWIPRLGGTQDVVPGRITHLTLEADEPGTYLGQCKEFCGLGHANMRLRAVAQTPGDFDAWLSDQQQPSVPPSSGLAAEGARLFAEGSQDGQFADGPACASCHAVDSTALEAANIGPNLTHFAGRSTFAGAIFKRTDENLAAWLENPAGVKPGALMPDVGLTQEQIDALVAYLQTLE